MDRPVGAVTDFVAYACVVNVLVELNEERKVAVITFVNWLLSNNVPPASCMCTVNSSNKMRALDLYEVTVSMVETCSSFAGTPSMIFTVISYELKPDVENRMTCVPCGGELR